MKLKSMTAVLLGLSLTISLPFAAYGKSPAADIRIENIATVWEEELFYTDIASVTTHVKIENRKSGIEYAKPAPNLVIELGDAMEKDTVIELKLSNAIWFFRDASYMNSGFSGGVQNQYPNSYDLNKGKFIPDSATELGGVYIPSDVGEFETNYELTILPDGATALLKLTEIGVKGETIVVPLVTKKMAYKDLYISVKSESEQVKDQFLLYAFVYKEYPVLVHYLNVTETYVANPAYHGREFPMDEIIIQEQITGTLTNGGLELIAPNGYSILPNIEGFQPEDITKDTLTDCAGDTISLTATDGVTFKRGARNAVYGHDYRMNYSLSKGVYNPRILRIDILGLVESEDAKKGRLTISGFKLVADDTVLDDTGNLYVSVRNIRGDSAIYEESFIAGRKYAYVPEMTPGIDVYNYTIKELMAMDEFHKKPFITLFEGNTIRPMENVTRGDIAQMLYMLLGDMDKEYEQAFSDLTVHHINAVAFCVEQGYLSGYEDGTFKPYNEITRAELAVALNNILKLNGVIAGIKLSGDESGHWAEPALRQVLAAGIMSGYSDGSVKPDNPVTRQEAVQMINHAFKRGIQFDTDITEITDLNNESWAYIYIMNALNGYTKQ